MALVRKPAGAAGLLQRFAYGDVPLEQWGPPPPAEPSAEPWASFGQARRLARAGQHAEAVASWRQIALTGGLASRVALQAWHVVRQARHQPPAERASEALGAVVAVPVRRWHDVLGAYRDGTARSLSHAGGAVIGQDREDPAIQPVIHDWMTLVRGLARALADSGPAWAWTELSLPQLPAGHLRVMLLTPSGPWFGHGPEARMRNEPAAQMFLRPATTLLQLLTSRATDCGTRAPPP